MMLFTAVLSYCKFGDEKIWEFFCFCFVLFISDKKNQPSALEQYNVIMRSLQGYELGCKLFSPLSQKKLLLQEDQSGGQS